MTSRFASIGLRTVLALGLVFAAYYCLVFARASFLFHQDTASSVPAAVALVPFNGAYSSRLAAWRPQRRSELLNRAVALNPFDVESWIQLGLTAELEHGDVLAAERYYLRAADVDKMFLPRWTLTNFYFRQQRADEFFSWARATLDITPYDAAPVFAQMWLINQDPSVLARFVPNRPVVLVQYTLYLANYKQYDAIPPIFQRLTNSTRNQNPSIYGRDELFGPMEDKLLAAGYIAPALQIWKSMAQANWIPYTPPTREHPLTNGDFRQRFFGSGFDWALANTNGFSAVQIPEDGVLRLALSGSQPEHVPLLRQFLPMQPGHSYRLTWRAEANAITSSSGLNWHVYPVGKAATDDLQSGDLLSSPSTWEFRSDGLGNSAILTLEYARPLGNTQTTGTVTLRSVLLNEQTNSHEEK